MFTPHTLASARFVHLGGTRFVSLVDVVVLLGGNAHAQDVQSGFLALPSEHRSIEDLPNESLVFEAMPVVTTPGLLLFLLRSPQAVLSSFAVSLATVELEKLFQVSPSSVPGGSTRWGEQPFRNLIRGTGLSMAQMVKTMNMHRQGEEKPLTQASLTSVAMGRQMPNPQMLRCLAMVMVAPPSKLFAPDVLAAYERKHGALPGTGFRVPQPAYEPTSEPESYKLRSFPPEIAARMEEANIREEQEAADSQFDPSENFEEWAAEQSRLMDAAAADAIGMPGMSFEAGFNTIMGQSSDVPADE